MPGDIVVRSFTRGAFGQNGFVLTCASTRASILVDPGAAVTQMVEAVETARLSVEAIVLTHAHIDHAGATNELAARLKLPIIGPHREDQFLIESLAAQSAMFGLGTAQSFVPDRWLDQGDVVEGGEEHFEVRHCPGHTPGHIIFYNPAHQFAIVGDVLFQGSIGRTDLPRGDHATLLASIRDQLLTLPDDTTFLPGHGPTSTIGRERAGNPFLKGL